MTGLESESNESVYERCVMETCTHGVKCGVGEWVKRNAFRWLGHIERKSSEEFVKKVYVSEIGGLRRRGRPVVRWKGSVKQYMQESGADRGEGLKK